MGSSFDWEYSDYASLFDTCEEAGLSVMIYRVGQGDGLALVVCRGGEAIFDYVLDNGDTLENAATEAITYLRTKGVFA